ncbi:MAG: hypothetical protein AB7G48_01670 [Nitrospiraceae bacterium]
MKHVTHRSMTAMALVVGLACVLAPMAVQASSRPFTWMDDLHGAIIFYQGDAYYKKEYPKANWDLYLDQIRVVETKYATGDTDATYIAMNRFMDMLEAREGGIPDVAANELFNFCNLVTPTQFHDVERHSGPPKTEQPRAPEGVHWPR